MNGTERPFLFSERNGYRDVPQQLRLGEISAEFRRLLDYAIRSETESQEKSGLYTSFFDGAWLHISKDFHVRFLRQPASQYKNSPDEFRKTVEGFCFKQPFQFIFDLVEFFANHPRATPQFKTSLAGTFTDSRLAYRLVNWRVVAIGNEEQGSAVEAALSSTQQSGHDSVRNHLVAAGAALRTGDWGGSVRDSIHAVEAMARRLDPDAKTIDQALKKLQRDQKLHPALKNALSALYGYTSDEEGVRHALVFNDVTRVDEADALFMFGACASFVSYLLSKGQN